MLVLIQIYVCYTNTVAQCVAASGIQDITESVFQKHMANYVLLLLVQRMLMHTPEIYCTYIYTEANLLGNFYLVRILERLERNIISLNLSITFINYIISIIILLTTM